MKAKRILETLLACVIAAHTLEVPAANKMAGSQSMPFEFPALVAACAVDPRDEYFKEMRTLFLVYPIGKEYSLLYGISLDGKIVGLADMHYDEGGLDAQGGVWSIYRAEDSYDYLVTRPFVFFKTDTDFNEAQFLTQAEPCKIPYKTLKGYEKS